MFLKNNIFYVACILMLASCANIVSPQGGAKDTTPPVKIQSFPSDTTTNFKQNKIVFVFQERIQLNEPEKNITISPSIKNGLKFEIKKNTLIIKVNNLNPNTTYTIKAKNSIADLTENNTLKTLSYVFSTGPTIDRNSVKGYTINSQNLLVLPGILVCLYKTYNDSNIILNEPDYITFSEENGSYIFDNISNGNYQLAAWADKNQNKKWEAGEELAFKSKPIQADTLNTRTNLRLFNQPVTNRELISVETKEQGVYRFLWNYKKINEIEINQEDSGMPKTKPYYRKITNAACIANPNQSYLISSHNQSDSAHFNYKIKDELYYTAVKKSKNKPLLAPERLNYTIYTKDSCTIPFLRNIDFDQTRLNKIYLYRDTFPISKTDKLVFEINSGLKLKNLTPGLYKLQLNKGALTDNFGIENDSMVISITVLDDEGVQSIILHTDSLFTKKYILQVTNENNYCYSEVITSNQTVLLSNLIPNIYRVRLIEYNLDTYDYDANIFRNIEPLKIVYFKEISLKKGFDVDEIMGLLYN